jgi:tetratricopeptide (TPR) repeat protein
MPTSAQRSISSHPCIGPRAALRRRRRSSIASSPSRKKGLGSDALAVATALEALSREHEARGPQAADELLFKRVLTIREHALAPDHPDVGAALQNLARVYQRKGRHAEAVALFKRSVAIRDKAVAREPANAIAVTAQIERLLKASEDAEAIAVVERWLDVVAATLPAGRPDVARTLNKLIAAALTNQAGLYHDQGRDAEAERLYRRSLDIFEKWLPPGHHHLGAVLHNLALLYEDQGRYAEAEPLFKRSLGIFETALGREHLDVGKALNNLAELATLQGDWAAAADYWRRSADIIKRRAERGLGGGRGEQRAGEARRLARPFLGLVRASHRAGASDPNERLAAEMFETAQWVQGTEAAASLTQMAARSTKGSPELAQLVRERQDLVGEWQARDKLLIASKAEPPEKREHVAERVLAARLAAIDVRLVGIDRRLQIEFTDYTALASSAPESVEDVQALLRAEEALVLFLDVPKEKSGKGPPEETFVRVVTKSGRALATLGPGYGGVDPRGGGTALRPRCHGVVRCRGGALCRGARYPPAEAPAPEQPLPFDLARAHRLYATLFGEVSDLIKGKHLLIVSSGPLTQLPFQVLVTKPPTSDDPRAVAWLARGHAVTILPAVSSLKALRRVGKPSTASKPMIGFGNPLLDGPTHATPAAPSSPERSKGVRRGRSRWRCSLGFVEACSESRHGAAWPTCRTSKCKSLCPKPPTNCALWLRT